MGLLVFIVVQLTFMNQVNQAGLYLFQAYCNQVRFLFDNCFVFNGHFG